MVVHLYSINADDVEQPQDAGGAWPRYPSSVMADAIRSAMVEEAEK